MKKIDIEKIVKEEVKLALEDFVGFKTTHAGDLIGTIIKHLETVEYTIVKSNYTANSAEAVVKAADGVVYHISVKPIANVSKKPSLADNLNESDT